MSTEGFENFARGLFVGLGVVTVTQGPEAARVYADGQMFALIAGDNIYLRADGALTAELAAEGSGPFVLLPRAGAEEHVELSYWRLPDVALDDPQLASDWGRQALAVARREP